MYLADLKHSWNEPQQTESGRGPCGTVTRHMKPPEPQCGFSLLYVHMHVYVCVSVFVLQWVWELAWVCMAFQ